MVLKIKIIVNILSNVYDVESNALEDTLISSQFSGWFVLMCAITRSSTELWYNAFNNDRHILHNFVLSTHYPSSGGYDNLPGFIDRTIWDCIYFAIWSRDCGLMNEPEDCYISIRILNTINMGAVFDTCS